MINVGSFRLIDAHWNQVLKDICRR